METLVRKCRLRNFHVASLENFRVGSIAWEMHVESCDWELSLGNFNLGTFECEPLLGASLLGSEAGGTGLLRLGELAGGSWGNLRAGHGATLPALKSNPLR